MITLASIKMFVLSGEQVEYYKELYKFENGPSTPEELANTYGTVCIDAAMYYKHYNDYYFVDVDCYPAFEVTYTTEEEKTLLYILTESSIYICCLRPDKQEALVMLNPVYQMRLINALFDNTTERQVARINVKE